MNRLMKYLVSTGCLLGVIYIAAITATITLDGRAFEFPNHHLVIMDGGFHLYSKQITYEFKADEQ